jgi:hypothetical protein
MKKRTEKPKRRRAARSDASVGSIERDIEKIYKLPKGSVQINNPNGRDARSDTQVGKLRKDHET